MGRRPRSRARSTDGGASFSVASRPAGTLYYSDWTLGGGTIFGGGTQTSYYAIETTAPASSRTIGGATRSDTRARALSADPAGNLFAVAGSGGEVVLDLVPAEASAVADSVRVDAGDFPCVAAFPGAEAAVVVYTRGDDVMAAVLEL